MGPADLKVDYTTQFSKGNKETTQWIGETIQGTTTMVVAAAVMVVVVVVGVGTVEKEAKTGK